jgi:sugar lactone lactonase YvrE
VLLVCDGGTGAGQHQMLKFDGVSGGLLSTYGGSYLGGPGGGPDLGGVIGPDGLLYKENFGGDSVARFDPATGNPMPAPGQSGADFVPAGSGGLSGTEGIAFNPIDGNLYVASSNSNDIMEYNGTSGAFITEFVGAFQGGLFNSNDLTFGPDGFLYVNNGLLNKVLRFDPTTGANAPSPGLTDANFIDPTDPNLVDANGMAFGPDGNLYVSNGDYQTSNPNKPRIVEYDGSTGAFIGVFVPADPNIGFIDGIRWGIDGNLYITNNLQGGQGASEILEYAPDGTPLGIFGDTATSGIGFAAGVFSYDDGTGPAPHQGTQHHVGQLHAQLDTLVVPQSTPLGVTPLGDQNGLAAAPTATTTVNPLLQALPAQNANQPGQVVQAQAATAVFGQDAIPGGLTAANIDSVFGQGW